MSERTRAARPAPQLEAYVLHQYEWSESSLILDLFTRDQGRLAVVAKGARRPYSQLRAVLLPFQRIQVLLGRVPKAAATDEPAPDIQTLRGAEWSGGQAMLTGAALFSGFYLNELLMKLLARHDAHPALFDAYAATLPCLGHADDARVQGSLRAFELKLLESLGLLPDLSRVTLTHREVDPAGLYGLVPEAGVLSSHSGTASPIQGAALIGLQAALLHGSLPALQQACAQALPELKAGLRALLHYHLGSPLMRTRKLMQDVQALERSNTP